MDFDWLYAQYKRTQHDIKYLRDNEPNYEITYEEVYDENTDEYETVRTTKPIGVWSENFNSLGALNATDLNRIENNMVVIEELLNENGYIVDLDIPNKNDIVKYTMESQFTVEDMDRIRGNLIILLEFVYDKEYTPHLMEQLGNPYLHYEHINLIEDAIYLVYKTFTNNLMSTKHSGEIHSGYDPMTSVVL